MSLRNKKKVRRVAKEIQRDFVCPYPHCNKQYGSEVSWNLHIKIKHNGGNKTEREKLAVFFYFFISESYYLGVRAGRETAPN